MYSGDNVASGVTALRPASWPVNGVRAILHPHRPWSLRATSALRSCVTASGNQASYSGWEMRLTRPEEHQHPGTQGFPHTQDAGFYDRLHHHELDFELNALLLCNSSNVGFGISLQ